jgi:hypothetical protein
VGSAQTQEKLLIPNSGCVLAHSPIQLRFRSDGGFLRLVRHPRAERPPDPIPTLG